MIAVDTSACARYISGDIDRNTDAVHDAIVRKSVYLPPAAQTELFSNVDLTEQARLLILDFPLLPILPGYWQRAGLLRAELKRRTLKAKIADVLIAQSCIDHDIPLITYDRDFRHFLRAGLKLA